MPTRNRKDSPTTATSGSAPGEAQPPEWDPKIGIPELPVDLKMFLAKIKKAYTEAALKRTGGNKSKAAELLGLNRTALVEYLRRKGRRSRR